MPELGKCCYANAKFIEDDPSNAPKCEEEFIAYCEKMISDTVNYCANKLKANNKFSNAELVRFAKRCLNKYHTEISNDIIDKNLSSLRC